MKLYFFYYNKKAINKGLIFGRKFLKCLIKSMLNYFENAVGFICIYSEWMCSQWELGEARTSVSSVSTKWGSHIIYLNILQYLVSICSMCNT